MKKHDDNYNGLSNEELCRRYQDGDEQALEILIRKNRRFVASVAHEILSKREAACVTMEELIDEGAIAIYEATKRYERQSGNTFLTFAGQVIRNKMHDLLDLYSDARRCVPLEDETREEFSHEAYIDPRASVEPYVIRKLFLEEVRACFLKLPERQQQILAYKFGIDMNVHPLETEGRELPDEVVAWWFGSKVSLVKRNQKQAYKYIRKRLFQAYKTSKADRARSEISKI